MANAGSDVECVYSGGILVVIKLDISGRAVIAPSSMRSQFGPDQFDQTVLVVWAGHLRFGSELCRNIGLVLTDQVKMD